MATDNQWPIYSLADYDGSGSLLSLCRQIVSLPEKPKQRSKRSSREPTSRSTSDYQTNEDSATSGSNNSGDKARLPTNGADGGKAAFESQPRVGRGEGLFWWQLIERDRRDPIVSSARSQVLELCAHLRKAVG